MEKYITIITTVPDEAIALKIKDALLNDKLIACISIVPKVDSYYWWEGEICRSHELLLIMKSVKGNFDKIASSIRAIHPYKVPEIVFFDIAGGGADYLLWIGQCVK